MRFSMLLIAAILTVAVLPASAQIGWGASRNGNGLTININSTVPVQIQHITGAPYSSEENDQSVQTLTDGTHLTSPSVDDGAMTYRDSMGRIRIERPMFPNRQGELNFTMVQVQDPVAGYFYVIDSVNQVVHRMQAQTMGPVRPSIPNPTSQTLENGTEITVEPLGSSTISGVAVVGTKTTTTYPAGVFVGGTKRTLLINDRPVTTTDETWWAPSLGLILSSTNSQWFGNVATRTMQNFSTAEPDPTLFKIPPGYKIVDETGGFTIKVTKQN
jgi:hypothetical protein